MIGATPTAYFVVPAGIGDPERVSGGNVYDVHLRDGLAEAGWAIRLIETAVGSTEAGVAEASNAEADLAARFSGMPDGAVVLVDGLVAVAASDALAAEASRLRMVLLAHMVASELADPSAAPGGANRERTAMLAARAVITTSEWTRGELLDRDLIDPARVVVAAPGAAPAPAASADPTGDRLLCLGVVAPHKGQDVLVRALADLAVVPGWTCTIAGSVSADPGFALSVSSAIRSAGLSGRVVVQGVLTGDELERVFQTTDLLVAPSRAESYGMAITEALARGIPVLATRTGGIPEAVAGSRAATLVPPDDPWALRVALRQWWTDPPRRAALKAEAMRTRSSARPWSETAQIVSATLRAVADDFADGIRWRAA